MSTVMTSRGHNNRPIGIGAVVELVIHRALSSMHIQVALLCSNTCVAFLLVCLEKTVRVGVCFVLLYMLLLCEHVIVVALDQMI